MSKFELIVLKVIIEATERNKGLQLVTQPTFSLIGARLITALTCPFLPTG